MYRNKDKLLLRLRYGYVLGCETKMKEQTEIGKIKEGRYIVVDDEPCKVVGLATSKPGKHGDCKGTD